MITLRHLLPFSLALVMACSAWAEKPGWKTFMPDGTVKARGESDIEDNRVIKCVVFDAEGRIQFIEYPVYNPEGVCVQTKRTLADGSPWPYAFPIYRVSELGGLSKAKDDIKAIQDLTARLDTSAPLLEITVVAKDRVQVKTGVVRGMLNGHGQFFELEKKGDKWINAKPGTVSMWTA